MCDIYQEVTIEQKVYKLESASLTQISFNACWMTRKQTFKFNCTLSQYLHSLSKSHQMHPLEGGLEVAKKIMS